MRRLVVYIYLFIMLLSLTGCSKSSTKIKSAAISKNVVVGFAQLGDESDWRTANSESIKNAAKEAGIELMFSNAEQKQENQIKAIRSFIANKVDVIAFSPIVESGWDNVLEEAKDAGIPVIITDRTIDTKDSSLYKTVIGSDFKEEGRKAGRWLLDKMKDVKGDINIVELQGNAGSAPAIDRKEGFEEIIKSNPNMKIIKSEPGDFMRSKGYEVMQSFLKEEGTKINVVYSHNDDMALGAIKAIEEYGLRPGKDITIVSIDATKAAFQEMLQGKLSCSVECNPLQGPLLMNNIKDILSNREVPKRIYVNESIFPAETAKEELYKRKY